MPGDETLAGAGAGTGPLPLSILVIFTPGAQPLQGRGEEALGVVTGHTSPCRSHFSKADPKQGLANTTFCVWALKIKLPTQPDPL